MVGQDFTLGFLDRLQRSISIGASAGKVTISLYSTRGITIAAGSYTWRGTHRWSRVCIPGDYHRRHRDAIHRCTAATNALTYGTRCTAPARHRRHHQHITTTTQVGSLDSRTREGRASGGVSVLRGIPILSHARHHHNFGSSASGDQRLPVSTSRYRQIGPGVLRRGRLVGLPDQPTFIWWRPVGGAQDQPTLSQAALLVGLKTNQHLHGQPHRLDGAHERQASAHQRSALRTRATW